MTTLLMSGGAALIFAIGGIFMKLSLGLSQPAYSVAVFGCFGLGAVLQTLVIAKTDLGSSYISILGLEAVVTLFFSIWLFKEQLNVVKLVGIAAIVMGVALLRSKEIG
ncbi:SMR family transporter [Chamaesiphon sp. VAR_69_metabat_338]|uniref:DMT family transporter n=1 Tax=Chamaesiphon sp. VAR_69_metabat_338 TaxID=2964704 RepID=UPI00286E7962|nr:SMR family transporter [Chamaesiphon sp. VAR_69_metabat_338]